MELQCLTLVLKHHSKSSARMQAVSKVKGRSSTDGFYYEQRIPLPRKVNRQWAKQTDGDEFFFGRKFVQYPDGSVFLHLELQAEKKDSYCPVEVQDAPDTRAASSLVPAAIGIASMDVEAAAATATGAMLDSHEPASFDGRGSKRRAKEQPTLMEEDTDMEQQQSTGQDDDEDAETIYSQGTIDAARARAAALLAQANEQEEAQLKKASNPASSSLQAAAGKMGPREETDSDL